MEKETTGLYLSGHPMDQYREQAKAVGAVTIGSIPVSYTHLLRENPGGGMGCGREPPGSGPHLNTENGGTSMSNQYPNLQQWERGPKIVAVEMCIRDRHMEVEMGDRLAGLLADVGDHAVALQSQLLGHLGDCLLYTAPPPGPAPSLAVPGS